MTGYIGTFNCHKRVTRCVSFSNNVKQLSFFINVTLLCCQWSKYYSRIFMHFYFVFAMVILNRIWDQGDKNQITFLFAIGTSTAFQLIISQKSRNSKHAIPFLNTIVFVYLKHNEIRLHL